MRRGPKKPASPKQTVHPPAAALRSRENAKRLQQVSNPRFIEPRHPAERDRPPSGSNWIHEIKADGYRAGTSA